MKLGTALAVAVATFYLLSNVLDKIACTIWMNPVWKALYDVKLGLDDGHVFTAGEVHERINKRTYSVERWPHRASVEGTGTNWTLRFDTAPMTWWRRAWWAVAHWELDPRVPPSYELRSSARAVKKTRSNGSVDFIMNDDEGSNSEPAHALEPSPSSGR